MRYLYYLYYSGNGKQRKIHFHMENPFEVFLQ